ncbi:MAG: D-alanyl-D-alanine carboxypeptidase family protein [Bulleidia sp.]
MRFTEQDIYKGDLILVNADHPLHMEYSQSPVPADPAFPDITVSYSLQQAYRNTMHAIHAGNRIVPVSGLRPHQTQVDLYNSSLEENGIEFTQKYVAKPGCSEHETGLALDVGENREHIDFIRPDFPYSGICQVFRETAPYFGMIERYGRSKQNITGISHEPWHFRYVGYPHASYITSQSLCLEEYIDLVRCHPINNPLYIENHTVFFMPWDQELVLPAHTGFTYSGNNVDGMIITVSEIL